MGVQVVVQGLAGVQQYRFGFIETPGVSLDFELVRVEVSTSGDTGWSFASGDIQAASLDHAMWFHAPIQFENWHLYTMDSPFTGGARGFNRGAIYTQDGTLVASVAQEGLVRPVNKEKAKS